MPVDQPFLFQLAQAWHESAAMGEIQRFAVKGSDAAVRRRQRASLVIAAIDESGQEKQGEATAGVKRQYMGCADA
ncbi:hypothetical protein [Acrocarpospora corrugata]|uniref:hypothetical protein n=1 Tax=Acrocarpospora corrugata TaxID=35763 RepID=UPI0012D358ED|nr:hypothetical protein [Acrocarpospora corrugata]